MVPMMILNRSSNEEEMFGWAFLGPADISGREDAEN